MYYRENGQIIEGLKGSGTDGLGCDCKMPSWIIILIIILLLIIITFFIYSYKYKGRK